MTILIALGSNQRHVRRGLPEIVLNAAVAALAEREVRTLRRSRTWRTAPVGPSSRRYANAVLEVSTELPPSALLGVLHEVEAAAGRRRRGRRWTARVLDLDLIAYGGKNVPAAAPVAPQGTASEPRGAARTRLVAAAPPADAPPALRSRSCP